MYNQSKVPSSLATRMRMNTRSSNISLFQDDPKNNAGERFRVHRGAFTCARCETRRSRDIFCTEWSKDSDCLVSRSSCMCQWRRSLGVGHSTTDHIPVSQQMGVNLLHMEVAHSILTVCSFPPHFRIGGPQQRRQKQHTKNGRVRVRHLPRQP